MRILSYSAPRSVDEALADLSAWGARARVLAGGTDLALCLQGADRDLEGALIDIGGLAELDSIRQRDRDVEIGALASLTRIGESALVRERYPVLCEVVDHFGSPQIRNAATLGGNLVNASPAADSVPALLVLDARVRLARRQGGSSSTRELPLSAFFTGPGKTLRGPEELLTAIILPGPRPGFRAGFHKGGTRPGLDISIVSVAVGFSLEAGRIRGARVALGASAPTPFRSRNSEALLEGAAPHPGLARAAARAAADESRPIDDVRASAWYRRHLITTLVEREIERVREG